MLLYASILISLAVLAIAAPEKYTLTPRQLKSAKAPLITEENLYAQVTKDNVDEAEQNKNAFYHFESAIDDKINDQTQSRTETREGSLVKGTFSYSDGYHRRTVHYEADENGYRILKEEIEPLDGPKVNLEGTASVHTAAHGNNLEYTIQSIPVDGEKTRIYDVRP